MSAFIKRFSPKLPTSDKNQLCTRLPEKDCPKSKLQPLQT